MQKNCGKNCKPLRNCEKLREMENRNPPPPSQGPELHLRGGGVLGERGLGLPLTSPEGRLCYCTCAPPDPSNPDGAEV